MKRISSISIIALISVLALSSFGMSATKTQRTDKRFTLSGRVLSVDRKAGTMLVNDQWSEKLYIVKVPDEKTFMITFGIHMNRAEAGIWLVNPKDHVSIECRRSTPERLAQLEDGQQAIVLIADR
jgi:hypothetical protein